MRKNGINRELQKIDGGVCAVDGFRANGIHCGIKPNEERDLALVATTGRCPTACVCATGEIVGIPVAISRKHVQDGYSRGIVINSGVANVFLKDGAATAKKLYQRVSKYLQCIEEDVLIASTGKMNEKLDCKRLIDGVKPLFDGLTSEKEGSTYAAEAIMTADQSAKELAFSFYLGDIPCKIGAIMKGSKRVHPNMATLIVVITTDVNIAPPMLQKALNTAMRDSFNMLDIDGISSPNDMVCIMANGMAGNYQISEPDTEYNKFAYILKETTQRICKFIATDGNLTRLFECKVKGVKSKQTARAIARSVVSASSVKNMLRSGELQMDSLLCAMLSADEPVDFSNVHISIESDQRKIIVYDQGAFIPYNVEIMRSILYGEEVAFTVHFEEGNFSAQAFSGDIPRVEFKE